MYRKVIAKPIELCMIRFSLDPILVYVPISYFIGKVSEPKCNDVLMFEANERELWGCLWIDPCWFYLTL